MATNPISGLIPRGSLGLKLLLICLLVLVMGVPLLVVGGLVAERQGRARQVTAELGTESGGSQVLGGPMLIVPFTRAVEITDDQGRTQRRLDRGTYVVFAETGTADTTLTVQNRRRGIYRAASYIAETDFDAAFTPAEAVTGVDPSYRFDWSQARIVMFVSDSRAIRNAAELSFADGTTATMEPISDLSLVPAGGVEEAGGFVVINVCNEHHGPLRAFYEFGIRHLEIHHHVFVHLSKADHGSRGDHVQDQLLGRTAFHSSGTHHDFGADVRADGDVHFQGESGSWDTGNEQRGATERSCVLDGADDIWRPLACGDAAHDIDRAQGMGIQIAGAILLPIFGALLRGKHGLFTAGDNALHELGRCSERRWTLGGVQDPQATAGAGAYIK